MYRELIKLNKDGKLSFEFVRTFNMDEYVGIPEDHPESYHSFMRENFFKHIDIKAENTNILNGNASDLELECEYFTWFYPTTKKKKEENLKINQQI